MRKLFIFLMCIGGLAAKAQIPQPDPDTTALHFLVVASISNLQEVSAGQLAAQKAAHTEVKDFGKMMAMDHQDAEAKLLQLAKARGYQLPLAATGGIQADLRLKDAGMNFDQLYVHAMVVSHASTVQTFENYATTGKDPAVKGFAQQMLPILKAHLAKIKTIDSQFKQPLK